MLDTGPVHASFVENMGGNISVWCDVLALKRMYNSNVQ